MKKKKLLLTLLILMVVLPLILFSNKKYEPLETVPFVDLDKYAGLWYEIASFPQRFQEGCHCTTARYTPTGKGYVTVENRCKKGSVTGPETSINGKAFVEKNTGNAKLKVRFFWPFSGKYWIIDLARDYSYAVVGHPNRDYLWILSRNPKMPQDVYSGIVQRAAKSGFDTSKLQVTKHQ